MRFGPRRQVDKGTKDSQRRLLRFHLFVPLVDTNRSLARASSSMKVCLLRCKVSATYPRMTSTMRSALNLSNTLGTVRDCTKCLPFLASRLKHKSHSPTDIESPSPDQCFPAKQHWHQTVYMAPREWSPRCQSTRAMAVIGSSFLMGDNLSTVASAVQAFSSAPPVQPQTLKIQAHRNHTSSQPFGVS